MTTKIQLLTTIESSAHYDHIFGQINTTDRAQAEIQRAFNNLGHLRAAVTEAVSDFDQFIETSNDPIGDLMAVVNAEAHAEFDEYMSRITFYGEPKALVPLNILGEKLESFDVFVGYAVAEDDFDIPHVVEHEGISEENAIKLMTKHNEWLRANKDIFDVFIDGATKEEAVEIIESL
jgi:hypothetical protein